MVKIDNLGYEGEGIGRLEDKVIFVPGALPSEVVDCKIVKKNKSYLRGELISIIKASPYRVEPFCPIYKDCGGCQLQHINYSEQLKFKRKRVEECLERIGGFDLKDILIHDVLGMENPLRYRNKIQMPVGGSIGIPRIGFYAQKSHQIVDMEKCYIQDETADEVVQILRLWMKTYSIPPYDERTCSGLIRHIMVRKGYITKEVMVVIVTRENNIPHIKELVEDLTTKIQGIKSIVQNVNTESTNVILGQRCITLWGEAFITDYIGDLKFNISPLSFFQVNPVQTKVLYDKALEFAGLSGGETVFDAYCGTGTISLFLSKKAKKVIGVEIIEAAVRDARNNAKVNGISNAEFMVGESEKIIPELYRMGVKADVVVVDPPRKGCGIELLNVIAQMKPKTIVYVSCDPASLGRDLRILADLGFSPVEVQPVDMFPFSAHVETIVGIRRV